MFEAGNAFNVIPQQATLCGTVRTLDPGVRELAEKRIEALVTSIAEGFGATVEIEYIRGYPVTDNHDEQTDFATDVAETISGKGKVNADLAPMMTGEDFSYMLQERPGAFIFAGNGDSAGLHHPAYDFNDDLIRGRLLLLGKTGRNCHADRVTICRQSGPGRARHGRSAEWLASLDDVPGKFEVDVSTCQSNFRK